MKIWIKTYWQALFLSVVAIANLLVWMPLNCFIAGILLMFVFIELVRIYENRNYTK